MVGKKVHRQPEQIRLCKHGHAESVAESVGAVVEEKKQEDPNPTRGGVWNIAVELGVALALSFVGIEVKSHGGDCERGGDAREADRNDRHRGPVAAIEEEDCLSESPWDRFKRHLGALADEHLGEWVHRSTCDVLVAACDADGVDRRLQQREYDA
jgi:hypothetical protein